MNICKYWPTSLLLFVLASCNQQTSEKDFFLSKDGFPRCPLGDNEHVEVFDFIVDYVKEWNKATPETRGQALLKNKRAEEINREILAGKVLKPWIASAYESQMANILHVFCHHFPNCRSLSLYARSGRILDAANDGNDGFEYADFIIKDDVYQKYQDGTLTGPYTDKNSRKTTYPIYFSSRSTPPLWSYRPNATEWSFCAHLRPNATDKPIGFIVYQAQ